MDLHLNLLKVIKNPGLIKLETKGTFLQMHRQLVDTFLGIEIQGKKSLWCSDLVKYSFALTSWGLGKFLATLNIFFSSMSAEQVRMERIKSLLKEMFNAIKSLDYSQSKGDASEQVYQSAESSFDSAQEENENIIKNVS